MVVDVLIRHHITTAGRGVAEKWMMILNWSTHFFLSLSFLRGCERERVSAATFLLLKAFISSSRSRRFSSTFLFSSWCMRFSCSNFSCNWRKRQTRWVLLMFQWFLHLKNRTENLQNERVWNINCSHRQPLSVHSLKLCKGVVFITESVFREWSDLSLLLLQLSLRLLYFVNEHLSHLLFLPLQVSEKLLPLGFICLL